MEVFIGVRVTYNCCCSGNDSPRSDDEEVEREKSINIEIQSLKCCLKTKTVKFNSILLI